MATTVVDKKPLNDRVKAKIDQLQRLVSHERTSEEECDAARRALQRIADAYELTVPALRGETGRRWLYNPGAWAGEKYESTHGLTLTEIAKLIREDLKLGRKVGRKTAPKAGAVSVVDPIGDAPAAIRFSVRTQYYSGGGSIDVTIKGIPEDWGWTMQPDYWGEMVPTATPAMAALYREVETIHNAYNYNNSDSMTDYYDTRYYGQVETEQRIRIPR